MIDRLDADHFEHLPGNTLPQRREAGSVALEVIEIVRPSPHSGSVARFAILLRENGVRVFEPQGTFVYDHPTLGELALFTVPIGPDSHGMRYEINFN